MNQRPLIDVVQDAVQNHKVEGYDLTEFWERMEQLDWRNGDKTPIEKFTLHTLRWWVHDDLRISMSYQYEGSFRPTILSWLVPLSVINSTTPKSEWKIARVRGQLYYAREDEERARIDLKEAEQGVRKLEAELALMEAAAKGEAALAKMNEIDNQIGEKP